MAVTTASVVTAAGQESYLFELVPLFPLPEVDLSVSVKSHFIRSRRAHRWIRAIAQSPLTFLGFITYLVMGISIFYVPARIGRSLGVVGLLVGLPGGLIPVGNLRFNMIVVMLKTYDMCFSTAVSTIVSVVLGMLLNDARAALLPVSWLSLMINICVDASMLGLRQIWVANIIGGVCYLAIAVAVSVEFTDELNTFHLMSINGHKLPAIAVVRDCLVTMVIVIGRNIVRKYNHAFNEKKIAAKSSLFRCASFRCRLQLCSVSDQTPRHDLHVPELSPTRGGAKAAKSKLQYKPDLELLDFRNTIVPVDWWWSTREETSRLRQAFQSIGAMGFGVTTTAHFVNIAWAEKCDCVIPLPIIIVAVSASTFFVGVTIAAMHRQLLLAVATSFDFLFIVFEVTIMHVALADILGWQPTAAITIFSDLQWCVWILCWDAITPPMRRRLGLTRRNAACIGFSLMATTACVAVSVLVFQSPEAIQDRVICQFEVFNHVVELRSFTWYFSCVATVSTWAIRVVWRLYGASENELIVLDGTVEYETIARAQLRARSGEHLAAIKPSSRNSPRRPFHGIPSMSGGKT